MNEDILLCSQEPIFKEIRKMNTRNCLHIPIVLTAMTAGLLLTGIAAATTTDSIKCVDYVNIGPDVVPQPGKLLLVSVNFTEAMDYNSKLTAELRIGASLPQQLKAGRWHAGGYTWRFAPITPGKAQGLGQLRLSGARTREDQKKMAAETVPICIGHEPLLARLRGIAEWMVANPSNLIFVEGYNQRTLLGLYEITGDRAYLEHVRDAAGALLAAQKPQGYWYSGWQNDIYFADTASALAMLVNFHKYATHNEQRRINAAFKLYLDLLLVRGDSKGRPFVHEEGSVGVGYQGDKQGKILNDLNQPYTIATGLTGAEIFAALYHLTGNEGYKRISIKACEWIMDTMNTEGKIPYIWDQSVENWEPMQRDKDFIWNNYPYDTSTYVGEGFIAAWTYIDDTRFRQHLANRVRPHIEWLLRTQNDDGSWARPLSQDQRRSHGVVNLLNWYYHNIYPDPRVAHAIQKYYILLLDQNRSRYLKIPADPVATGLAGRALIDIIRPGVDCRRW